MIMNMNSFFAAHSDLDVDAPLYRIMLKKHLEQLLRTNTLYFRKVALWDDTWEVPHLPATFCFQKINVNHTIQMAVSAGT